jgi:hypothetical protein
MIWTPPPDPKDDVCPRCRKPYPWGDPRAVFAPRQPCVECEWAERLKLVKTKKETT